LTPSALGAADGGVNGETTAGNGGLAAAFFGRDEVPMENVMPSQIRFGLQFLWDSHVYALELAQDPWELSVEWLELQRQGLTCNDVRWLIQRGLVRHACEVTGMEDQRRRFVACANLSLSSRTCLILTEEGGRLARLVGEVSEPGTPSASRTPSVSLPGGGTADAGTPDRRATAGPLVPEWDRDRRQLRVDSRVVKEFKVPAPNQEIVLAVFEEENWPPKIDDPLPHKANIDPQRRLHDTINSLNRRQRHRLVRFGADGLGRGVRWEISTRLCSPEA
jgi:hypothetical protein